MRRPLSRKFLNSRVFHMLAKDQQGSATLEFVMIAIPLFVPLALYLSSVNSSIQNSLTLKNVARQAARAFITSPSEALAPVRAQEVLNSYRTVSSGSSAAQLSLSIQCESNPCLTPNSKVTLTVSDPATSRLASATQVVDAWRSSE